LTIELIDQRSELHQSSFFFFSFGKHVISLTLWSGTNLKHLVSFHILYFYGLKASLDRLEEAYSSTT